MSSLTTFMPESKADADARSLADMIFNAGSVLSTLSPAAAVRADCKLYKEGERRFSVSQVEELGFTNFWKCEDALLEALEKYRMENGLSFSCLLVTDIDTQKQAEARVGVMAQRDPLTDLPNRALLADRLSHALASARRNRSTFVVMEIELEGVAPINEALGRFADAHQQLALATREWCSAWPEYQTQQEREKEAMQALSEREASLLTASERAAESAARYEVLKGMIGAKVETTSTQRFSSMASAIIVRVTVRTMM